jgi:cytochrome c biogenesis protein CcmG/thiol:disulfide interchange protein DsbE
MVESQTTTRSSRSAMFVFVGAAILISGILTLPWLRRSDPLIPIAQRQAMPTIALQQLGGGTWRLTDHRGQAILINYWATWCGPCRTETPGLVHLAQQTKGLAVVGISMDTGDREVVQSFVRQFKLEYPIAFPEPMSQMASGMVGLPTTILVDRNGKVAKTYIGQTSESEFRHDISRILGE